MKKLSFTLKLELEIPDDWKIETTSDGIETLKMGDGRYLDLGLEPMCFDDGEENRISDLDESFRTSALSMVKEISTELRLEERAVLASPLQDFQ